MIDADLPGRDSSHPRPLLPVRTGNWASRAVNTVKGRYLEVEGYAKASYINFSACETVYLSCGPAGGLQGIFAEDGKDRQALYLGHGSKRTVKVLGLRRFAQCDAVLIQVSIALLAVLQSSHYIRFKLKTDNTFLTLILPTLRSWAKSVIKKLKAYGGLWLTGSFS
jgi:hypothetical protein